MSQRSDGHERRVWTDRGTNCSEKGNSRDELGRNKSRKQIGRKEAVELGDPKG